MQVDLSSNYFDLFGLPRQFVVDESALTLRFRQLQTQLHPDKFASEPSAQRRWSMQAASFVNAGFQTLSHDLKRAIYLLELHDISVDEETDTQMAPEFLMQQMEHREALEMAESAADPLARLDGIRAELKVAIAEQSAAYAVAVESRNWSQARTVVRQWQFLDKLTREVKSMEERLDQ